MEIDKLLSGMINLQLWLVLAAAFALGMIGALTHRWTQDPPPSYPAGRDAALGGIAAVAILYVTAPASAITFIGGSLVAGYAAKVVLSGLEARLTAAIALRDAADHQLAARRTRDDLGRLAARVAAVPATPESSSTAQSPGQSPAPSAIADVQRLARELQTKHALA